MLTGTIRGRLGIARPPRFGGTKKLITAVLAPVDPLTYADRLKTRKLLMVAAKNDEIVPPPWPRTSGTPPAGSKSFGSTRAISGDRVLPAGLKNITELFGK